MIGNYGKKGLSNNEAKAQIQNINKHSNKSDWMEWA